MRLFASLHGYQRPWLRGDLIAGLTLWAILVPQALAYASIVERVAGRLYAAPGALLYAALGSSRVLAAGPMRPPALSAATVADLALVGAGAAPTAAGHHGGRRRPDRCTCAFGFLAEFISPPVLKGLIIGLALTIIIGCRSCSGSA